MSSFVLMGVSKYAGDPKDEWLLERRRKHAGMLVERLLAARVPFKLSFAEAAEIEIVDQYDAAFKAEDEVVCEVFRAEDDAARAA